MARVVDSRDVELGRPGGNPHTYTSPGAPVHAPQPGNVPPGTYAPAGYAPAGYAPAGYAPAGYAPAGYAPPGYAPAGYAPPGYAPAGYAPAGYAPPGYAPPGYAPQDDSYSYAPQGYDRGYDMYDEAIRQGFVRKVYGTVAAQLLVTCIIAAPIATASRWWLHAHSGLFLISTFGTLATVLAMSCCDSLTRKHPINLIFLGLFTVLEAISVGFFCAQYHMHSVLWTALATAVITGSLMVFATYTKVDVTSFDGYLTGISLGVFLMGLIGMFFHAPLLHLIYACCGAALAAAYIVYDTQLVAGGKHHSKQFGVDDYVPAAIALYTDIVQLFLFLLELLGVKKDDNN